MMIYDVKI